MTPFSRRDRLKGGTGLGLSVTYNLVKAHSGDITFKSQKGKGTSFTVSLPLRVKESKIMVVDDDEKVRDVLKKSLTLERPYLVKEVDNGIDASVKLGTYRPDLIILDIFMQGMDGLEVCRSINKDVDLSGMKVIVLTGFPHDRKVDEIRKLGFTHIWPKPFKTHELLKAVDSLLE